jgi:hypothetical protein
MTKTPDEYPLPDPGRERFWHGVHNPSSVKTPLTLELRERTVANAKAAVTFSKLIAKQPTIADPKAVKEAADEILIRAERVDDFIGILKEGEAA